MASRASTIRSTEPNSLRTTRPSSAGSAANDGGEGDRGVVQPALLDDRDELIALDEGHVAREHEHLLDATRQLVQRRAHGVPGAARDVLQGEPAAPPDDVADRLGRGRVDDDRRRRPAVGAIELRRRLVPRVEDVGEHRPAAQRVEDLGRPRAHARAESRRKDDRRRPAGRLGT